MVRNPLLCERPGLMLWVGKIPWRRASQPTPVFLPGESPRTEKAGRSSHPVLKERSPEETSI